MNKLLSLNELDLGPDQIKQQYTEPCKDIYEERFGNTFSFFKLYQSYYQRVPNVIYIRGINCKSAYKNYVAKEWKTKIQHHIFSGIRFRDEQSFSINQLYIFLKEFMLVFNFEREVISVLFHNQPPEHLCKELTNYFIEKPKDKPKINVIIQDRSLELKEFIIKQPQLSIQDNYNNDFQAVHHNIQKKLSAKNEKGIVLLHGTPGTGKTNYIKYLTTIIDKEVIFLPPNLAKIVDQPALINFVMNYPNSVFVIEDAEQIIMQRESRSISAVSALLNMSDGLLADCLNIQFICSFNTDISKIDRALLRKGRLIAKYEFTKLKRDKAQQLSDKLGFSTRIEQPMTLAEIYNQKEQSYDEQPKLQQIGFIQN